MGKVRNLLVVGSGLYGLTISRLAAEDGVEVQILEKRSHLGGNSYSKIDPKTNVDVHTYGSHLFHTNNRQIWRFVNEFSEFNNYRHFVVAKTSGDFMIVPPNISTYQQLYPEATHERDLWELVERDSLPTEFEIGLEAKAIQQMGRRAYERLIKGYTQKQWQVAPSQLPEETIARLPVRRNHSPWYFSDKYQGVPIGGYGNLTASLADHPKISVDLSSDFFQQIDRHIRRDIVVYTGALDALLDYKFGSLGWRTVEFEMKSFDIADYQGAAVVNYPDLDVNYTRVHEFKHLHPEDLKRQKGTTISFEYSRLATKGDEPYYPINAPADRLKAAKYKTAARKSMKNIHLGGRLATYKYLDMHMAIGSAMRDWEQVIRPRIFDS